MPVLACFLLFSTASHSQNALNVTELGHLSYAQSLSEVRGAQHNGHEYALVGVQNGFSIVDVQDPADPVEVFFEPGPNSIWRDPFYHNGHAYCVTEGGGGLLIVDMSPLPGSTTLSTTLFTGSTFPMSSAHNMFIDTDNDRAYIFGSDQVDGVIILDISSPMAPFELGIWNDHYIHDGFVRGDTLWAACLSEGAFVVDVSVPSSPVILANWDTPSEFAHNIWPSDDNAYCYTTDEVNSGFVTAYDMANLQNVVEVDRDNHPLSSGVIPHNSHFLNDFVVTAHYTDGLIIHDVADPSNMVMTGYFDSSPMSGGGFNGAWGAWPYLPSGNILVADIQEGLFVLGPTYKQAARLEGTVTELGTGIPLNDVQIEILTTGLEENSDIFGDYATGMEAAGTYSVMFQKGGYLGQTTSGVVLTNGQTTVLDVELVPEISFVMQGTVTETGTGNPIEGATVQVINEFFDIELTTDENGQYVDSTFFGGQYEVSVGSWGYVGQCLTVTVDLQNQSFPAIELMPGYHDDFSLDLGWSVIGDASTGIWVRGLPNGTEYNGTPANPDQDADGDCGGYAFVTGNAAGAVHVDDVDDGMTVLLSPTMDLSGMTHAIMQFHYWFFNQGGDGNPNDELLVRIDNGAGLSTIASLPVTNDIWTEYSVALQDHTILTSDMQLRLEIQDAAPGHLVEGGIDLFLITNATTVEESGETPTVLIFPNPNSSGILHVEIGQQFSEGHAVFRDALGRQLSGKRQLRAGLNTIASPRTAGVYLIETIVDGRRNMQQLLVQ